jgi:multiple sugar transport system ATP-binding protein
VAEIILDHISKRFPDGSLAVNDISLDIVDGEFIILVGPSGCGKSTTLNMIAGLEDITSGELRIGGKVVNDKAPKDRDIAMVFQSYALYPHMTVRENMGFALKLAKTPKNVIDEKVSEAARVLDLAPFLDRRPANLSGGQRQRVAMGRAIVRDPAAFLMDEPLSNLDAKLRVQTRTEVSRLQKRLGTTMVYVTHDQTEAMTLGDRVAVMRLGTIQQVASPQELYDAPVNLFVAGFIGSPAMNFMAGTVEDGKLRTGVGDFPLTPQLRQELERAGTGRDVIVGIRPESFEDAEIVPAEVRPHGIEFNTAIDVVESLGSEKFVYFTRDLGQTHNLAELEELARDSGRAAAGGAAAETVVARLDPASRIREGEDARLWVDVRKLHVFDTSTGRNLSLGADGAPGAAAPAAAAGAGATGGAADRAGQASTAGGQASTTAEQASTTAEQAPTPADQASTTADPASGTDSQ